MTDATARAAALAPARPRARRAVRHAGTVRPAPTPRQRRTRRRVALCAGVFAAAAGFLLYKGLTSAFVYFKTAAQAVSDRAALGNSVFQVEGTVVPCTIRRAGLDRYDFAIASGTARIAVRDTGTPSALFQPNIPVVLQGHFVGGSDVFAADQILVKHSNQYVAAHPGRVARGSLPSRCPVSA